MALEFILARKRRGRDDQSPQPAQINVDSPKAAFASVKIPVFPDLPFFEDLKMWILVFAEHDCGHIPSTCVVVEMRQLLQQVFPTAVGRVADGAESEPCISNVVIKYLDVCRRRRERSGKLLDQIGPTPFGANGFVHNLRIIYTHLFENNRSKQCIQRELSSQRS